MFIVQPSEGGTPAADNQDSRVIVDTIMVPPRTVILTFLAWYGHVIVWSIQAVTDRPIQTISVTELARCLGDVLARVHY